MISAPLNCSASRSPVVHPVATDGQATAADVQHEWDVALSEPRPERIVVGMTWSSASGSPRGEPHEVETHVQGSIELVDGASGLVEVTDRDAVEALVRGAEVGHGAVVRPIGAVPQTRVVDLIQRGAERRVHDLMLEPEQVERAAALVGVDGSQRSVPLGPSPNQVVAQLDQARPLVLRVLPLRRIDAVRDHDGLDVRQTIA